MDGASRRGRRSSKRCGRPRRAPMSPRPSWSSPVPFACPACGGTRLSRLAEDVTETLEVIPRQWIGTYFSALRAPWQKGRVENPKARSRRFRPLVVDIARLRRPRPMGTASAGRGSAAKSSLRPAEAPDEESQSGHPQWDGRQETSSPPSSRRGDPLARRMRRASLGQRGLPSVRPASRKGSRRIPCQGASHPAPARGAGSRPRQAPLLAGRICRRCHAIVARA